MPQRDLLLDLLGGGPSSEAHRGEKEAARRTAMVGLRESVGSGVMIAVAARRIAMVSRSTERGGCWAKG